MKKLKITICTTIISMLLSACSTVPVNPDDVTTYITANAKALTTGAEALTKVALTLAQKDPVKRQELKEDINLVAEKIARGLDAAVSTTDGTLSPSQLAADLKVRDEGVQAFLDGLVVIYQEGYAKLEASGKAKESIAWAKLISNSLKILADGLNKATIIPAI